MEKPNARDNTRCILCIFMVDGHARDGGRHLPDPQAGSLRSALELPLGAMVVIGGKKVPCWMWRSGPVANYSV